MQIVVNSCIAEPLNRETCRLGHRLLGKLHAKQTSDQLPEGVTLLGHLSYLGYVVLERVA
jgi:hypothetical protein